MLIDVVGWDEAVQRFEHAIFLRAATPSKALRVLHPMAERVVPYVVTRYLGSKCDPNGRVEVRPLRRGDGVSWGDEIVADGIRPHMVYPVIAVDEDALALTIVDDGGDNSVVLMTSGLKIKAEAFL